MLDLGLTVAAEAPRVEPRSLVGRSIAACLCLAAHLGLALFECVAHRQRLGFLRLLQRRIVVDQSVLLASDALIQTLARLHLLLTVATVVAFLVWLHRANGNVAALRPEPLDFSPGRAVGSFFIPFLNLFLGYYAVQEVWQGSDPAIRPSSGESYRTAHKSPLVLAWWLLFLVRGVPSWFILVSSQAAGGERLQRLIGLTEGQLATGVLTIPAAVAAIAVVFLVDQRQSALIESLEEGPEAGPMGANTIV